MLLASSKVLLRFLACALLASANGLLTPQLAAQDQNADEVSARNAPITFRTGTKEVVVRVVVRDEKGNAVGDLKREDFTVFDKSAAQKIVSFRMETAEGNKPPNATRADGASEGKSLGTIVPDHYIAYLFDDIHIDFGDLAHVREAALKHMTATLKPGDRAAIYTTSAQVTQDFTDDPNLLRAALERIVPRPVSHEGNSQCPWISFYVADLIVTHDDQNALNVVARDLMSCEGLTNDYLQQALIEARMKAHSTIAEGNSGTRTAVLTLKSIVQRMSTMAGQKTLVLASPGFLVTDLHRPDLQAMIERAVRSNVIVSTLDAQGLWTEPSNQASNAGRASQEIRRFMDDSQRADRDVLEQIADGTGGTYFHNNNDFAEGLRRTAATPEYSYVMTFSPQGLKSDGSYHPLKVTLANAKGLTVTARRGFFAPSKAADEAEAARQEIEDAIFSREEISGIPVDVHTQYFKTSGDTANVDVVARVQVHRLNLKKTDGLNSDNVTVVAALFDHNGQYITAQEKLLELHMHDAFLERVAQTGIVVKSNFEVKSGDYLVRVVVRDAEGQMLSAKNGTVEIP